MNIISRKDYEGIILTSCCDSVKRLYDILKKEFPDKFIYAGDILSKLFSRWLKYVLSSFFSSPEHVIS